MIAMRSYLTSLVSKLKDLLFSTFERRELPRGVFLRFSQSFLKKFMKNHKKGLDIHGRVYYNIGARVGEICACNCDDAGDCAVRR